MNKHKLLLLILVLISISFIISDTSLFAQKDHNGQNKIQLNTLQNSGKKEEGKDIYQKYCLSCHQVDGNGVPGMFPPLQKSDWVSGDKKRIILVVLNGIKGNIIVNDETYSQVMPKQDNLTDEQIARVLTFIRNNFGNKADSVYPHEVLSLRGPKKPGSIH
jgi:mono/diheme cytochrome c family protein